VPISDLQKIAKSSSSSLSTRSQQSLVLGCLTTLCLCGWVYPSPQCPDTDRMAPNKIGHSLYLGMDGSPWFAAREIRDAYNAHRAVGALCQNNSKSCMQLLMLVRCRKSSMGDDPWPFLLNGGLFLHRTPFQSMS